MYDTAKEYADLIKAEEYEYAAEPEDLEERRAMLRKHYGEQLKSRAMILMLILRRQEPGISTY
ncbi:hypothetical protein A0256_08960 [Mucilaginibacter sp. PAMC 26640]|nr:hypothetical protein A0256_08960 [Mucilaginibacter sp. PAMC 26640]